jgi:hypothetical protein
LESSVVSGTVDEAKQFENSLASLQNISLSLSLSVSALTASEGKQKNSRYV